MTSRQTVTSEAALIPLLLGERRCNVTFVVDSSDDMRAVLWSVKWLLIRVLQAKASFRDSLFNVVTFSGEVSCWSHHMLPCSPDTVHMALSWIHAITCSPGRDLLLAALRTALADPACHAIHLLSKSLPDRPRAVLTALTALAAGRPVNVFYLQDSGGRLGTTGRDYLWCLTQATGGRCYEIPVGLNGVMEKVIPRCVAENRSTVPTIPPVKCCCPSTSVFLSHNRSSSLLRCSLGNPLRPATSCGPSGRTLRQEFFPGCRVLARRKVDGLYHIGTVIQRVQDLAGVWLVEFDGPGGAGVVDDFSQRQLVCSLDMVSRTGGHVHCLVPGDAVLSPWEPDLRRHGPGRVLAATEHRVDGVACLRVLMWNNCVSLVPGSLVLPIPVSYHDRMVRELQISPPASGRCCCCWLCARCSSCTPQLFCSDCRQSPSHCCSVTNHRPYSVPPGCRSSSGGVDGHERTDQDTDLRKSEPEVSFSSSSSLSEDDTRATLPPAVKLRSKEQRPPWRYWRRTGPEPQHVQPGSVVPRTTSQFVRFSFPVPQVSASPNHSALFQALPHAKGRRANRCFLEQPHLNQEHLRACRPSSGTNATTV